MYKAKKEYNQAFNDMNDEFLLECTRLKKTGDYKRLCQVKENKKEWLKKYLEENPQCCARKSVYHNEPPKTKSTIPSDIPKVDEWERVPMEGKVNDNDYLFRNVFYKIAMLFTIILLDNLPTIPPSQTFLDERRNAVESTIKNLTVQCNLSAVIIDRWYKGKFMKYLWSGNKYEISIYFPSTKDTTYNKPFGINTFTEIMQKLFINELMQRIIRGKNNTSSESHLYFYQRVYRSLINKFSLKDAVEDAIRNVKPTKAVRNAKPTKAVINAELSYTSHTKLKFTCYHSFFQKVANRDDNIIILTQKAMVFYKEFVLKVLYEKNLGIDIIKKVLDIAC